MFSFWFWLLYFKNQSNFKFIFNWEYALIMKKWKCDTETRENTQNRKVDLQQPEVMKCPNWPYHRGHTCHQENYDEY